jgi:hypothetical protein
MAGGDDARPRTFTVLEANAALPLVRAIAADLVRVAREVSDRSERLSVLLGGRRPPQGGDPYADELAQVASELGRDRQRLREYADELIELGLEPRSAIEGLVHFPTVVDGRVVHLCWKLGEPEVLFWHEVDGNFDNRRPLAIAGRSSRRVVAAGRSV